MRVLGIDPGLVGGVACLITGHDLESATPRLVDAIDVPTFGDDAKRRVDAVALRRWVIAMRPDRAFIERAQAMPDQGSSSGFHYGRAVGYLEAVVQTCNVPLYLVEPRAWKRYFELPPGGDKEAARQLALRIIPEADKRITLKKHHGRAEAALIAAYGADLFEMGTVDGSCWSVRPPSAKQV